MFARTIAAAVASVLLGVAAWASITPAAPLMPGMKAPELRVGKWIKKGPIDLANTDRVTVVEFWATWCGPCRTSIPHLTKLAKQYEGKVDIVGVSIWERGDDIPGLVRQFVEEMGAQMDYHVAIDADDTHMTRAWMDAALRNGIPSAFIVDRSGQIAWIGHPMQMDAPLRAVVEGTHDIAAEAEKYRLFVAQRQREIALREDLRRASQQMVAGQIAEAEATFDTLARENPQSANEIIQSRLNASVSAGAEVYRSTLAKVAQNNENGLSLALFAYRRAQAGGENLTIGLQAAEAAKPILDSQTDVVGHFYIGMAFTRGEDFRKAVDAFETALRNFDNGPMANQENMKRLRADIVANLESARKKILT